MRTSSPIFKKKLFKVEYNKVLGLMIDMISSSIIDADTRCKRRKGGKKGEGGGKKEGGVPWGGLGCGRVWGRRGKAGWVGLG